MITAVAIFIMTLIGKLLFDVHLYYSGRSNEHTLGPLIVLIALIACSWVSHWYYLPGWMSLFWACFDPLYAVLIGQKWHFVGSTSFLDRLQHRYPFIACVKYILGVTSLILFIVL